MSTNFYATVIPSEKSIQELELLLIRRQIKSLKDLLDSNTSTYHIGKCSGGWQFLFCPHVKSRLGFWDTGRIVSPWYDNLDSIKNFLSREDVVIEDEYGRKYTSEEFWKKIGPYLYNDPEKYINGEQYYANNPTLSRLSNDTFDYTTDEGLRFSVDDNFS